MRYIRCSRLAILLVLLAGPTLAHAQRLARHATLPAVSPDGKRVAYLRSFGPDSAELRVMRLDGSGDHAVVPAGRLDGTPGWMAGGRRVTLAITDGDSSALWSFDPNGGEARREAIVAGKGVCPSNDGRRLAYARGTWTVARLMVCDMDGSHSRALTDSSAGWYNIAWSPDDRAIAVTHNDTTGDMQVWLVDPTSGATRPVTAIAPSDGRPQWPAWSPDGKRIAVQSGLYDRKDPARSVADIHVIDVTTRQDAKITSRAHPWLDETPSWCADGRRLVIQSTRSGAFELWTIGADGRGARPLTRTPGGSSTGR